MFLCWKFRYKYTISHSNLKFNADLGYPLLHSFRAYSSLFSIATKSSIVGNKPHLCTQEDDTFYAVIVRAVSPPQHHVRDTGNTYN